MSISQKSWKKRNDTSAQASTPWLRWGVAHRGNNLWLINSHVDMSRLERLFSKIIDKHETATPHGFNISAATFYLQTFSLIFFLQKRNDMCLFLWFRKSTPYICIPRYPDIIIILRILSEISVNLSAKKQENGSECYLVMMTMLMNYHKLLSSNDIDEVTANHCK